MVGFVEADEGQTVLKAIRTMQVRQGQIEDRLIACGLVSGGTDIADADRGDYDTIGTGEDDGSVLGAATTDKVGFWGMAPSVQVSAFTAAVTVTTQPVIITTVDNTDILAADGVVTLMAAQSDTGWGFKTVNNAQSFLQVIVALESRVAEIDSRLQTLGIMTGGTAKTDATKYDYLDKNNDDGTLLGRDPTAKVGFWGTTPLVRPAALTTAAITITSTAFNVSATDVVVQAVASGTDSFFFIGTDALDVTTDAVRRLQTRQGEIEEVFRTTGLLADDGISGG